ncbi:MAG: type VII secretion protein EssC [Bacillota bacterium]|nr:type VII secretion protein EssC [Bacillota bacterium]
MNLQYKIIISSKNIYREIELPMDAKTFKVGTTKECDYRLPKDLFFEEIRLDLTNDNGQWIVMGSDNIYLSMNDSRKLFVVKLSHGDLLVVKYQSSNSEIFNVEFTVDFDTKERKFERQIDILNKERITIGSKATDDIQIKGEYIGNDEITITKNNGNLLLTINTYTYGVYLNGNKVIQNVEIKNCDFFSISDFMFYYKNNCLWTEATDQCLVKGMNYTDKIKNNIYPKFIRNTRIKTKIDNESISVLNPNSIPKKPELNLVTSLMPTLMMFALVVVLRGFMSKGSGGTYILFSIASMGMGVVTSIANIVSTQKKYKRECRERIDKYNDYIARKKEKIQKERQKELNSLRSTYYSTQEDLEHLLNYDSCLFDRMVNDDDFLDVYLGVGRRKANKLIDYKKQEKLETGDDLTQIPSDISKDFKFIENAPITVSLKDANAIGVIGQNQQLYSLLKCFIVDLVSRHYYGDLNIYLFINEDIQKYKWVRFIPHFQQGDYIRNIVCDNQSKNTVFETLYKELMLRSENKGVPGYNVVLMMDDQGIKSHPISRFIENASELNTTFVFFENNKQDLPLHCTQVIQLTSDEQGELFKASDRYEVQKFTYQHIDDDMLTKAAQIIAPTYCEEISLAGTLKKNISLYELLGIYSADDIDLKSRWNESRIYETMAVPLGVNAKDEIVNLNLHEKFHGPHGLVAGTTGSGKSEILQAYILSAATLFHPYEIGFVIIDFKGGGMVNQFRNLPHLIGAITNIDGNEIDRSLKSIKAELLKRQSCFAKAGVNHIDKYIQLYKQGKVSVPLPHLVMIVDEFAELKSEHPDFMKELISAARIGRSLGVHLILATQKPSGVVDGQIWSNSKFKLCLKVQSKEDSNEVIKTPLAAEIKEPGRAYLQVGNNEIFELFQSAYSGAPAVVDASEIEKEFKIKEVNFAGIRSTVYEKKKQKKNSLVQKTQLEAVVDYINNYCKQHKIKKLQNICLPSLPKKIDFPNIVKSSNENTIVHFGIYDDPDHQIQEEYNLNLTTSNYMIIGSGQTGKTNILQSIIRNISTTYSPDEVSMYIIDFGSMILRNFNDLKHVGGVVTSTEDEKLKNLFRLLNEEVARRKETLSEIGVSSFAAYKEAGLRDLSQIVVLIDNVTALKELYLQDNDQLLPLCRDGLGVGISFVLANAQTAGFGYRYLSNFDGRISLYSNDTTEYSMLFESSRLRLPNIPGRSLVKIEKDVYECQAYLSFEGEKEFDRVKEIKSYVHENNQKWNEFKKVKVIPEIPKTLSYDYIQDNYELPENEPSFVLGLDYATVQPVFFNYSDVKFLAMSGRKDSYKNIFARNFVAKIKEEKNADIYIFDDIQGRWGEFDQEIGTEFYSTSEDTIDSILEEIHQILESRFNTSIYEGIQAVYKEPPIVLVIENNEVITNISKNNNLFEMMKDILEKYQEMGAMVLFTNISNAQIPYNASGLMKMIKEDRNYLIFDDISNIKLVDIPVSLSKKYAKQLGKDDAYYMENGVLRKIKIFE